MGFFDKLLDGLAAATEDKKKEVAPEKVQNEQPKEPEKELTELTVKYGSKEPIPFTTECNGKEVVIELKYSGCAHVTTEKAEIVRKCGGLEAISGDLRSEIVENMTATIKSMEAEKTSVSKLQAHSRDFSNKVQRDLNKTWPEKYGVIISKMEIRSIMPTEESNNILRDIMRG